MSSLKLDKPGDEEADFKNSPTRVWRWLRQHEPKHFLLKVESFSVLSESKIEKYESDEFEACDYKWKLILYPNGDKKRNGSNYISLYLSLCDTKALPQGWQVEAHFSLFVYNNLSDKYLTCQVANASARRFHGLKTDWGFAQLLSLEYFKDASNGYLLDDTCVFGAEVSVITSVVAKRQSLSMIKETNNKIFSWKVDHFSEIKEERLSSEKFKMGELEWKLELYPKGNADGEGKSISLYLEAIDDLTISVDWKAYAEYKLRIRNQVNSNHSEKQANCWFSTSCPNWGYHSFMPLSDLNDKSKGFVVNDTLVVEVEISITAMTKNFK